MEHVAAADGVAGHHGHDRLRAAAGSGRGGRSRGSGRRRDLVVAHVAGVAPHPLVAAGAERPSALTGEDDHADVGILAGQVERADDLDDRVRAERVPDLGPVDRDLGDAGSASRRAPSASRSGCPPLRPGGLPGGTRSDRRGDGGGGAHRRRVSPMPGRSAKLRGCWWWTGATSRRAGLGVAAGRSCRWTTRQRWPRRGGRGVGPPPGRRARRRRRRPAAEAFAVLDGLLAASGPAPALRRRRPARPLPHRLRRLAHRRRARRPRQRPARRSSAPCGSATARRSASLMRATATLFGEAGHLPARPGAGRGDRRRPASTRSGWPWPPPGCWDREGRGDPGSRGRQRTAGAHRRPRAARRRGAGAVRRVPAA